MGIVFDTDVIIDIERGSSFITELIKGRKKEPFGISVVTAAELIHGVKRADTEERRIKRHAFVEKIISLFPVYPVDLAIARIYAGLWASCEKKKMTIGAHDLIIAATAVSLGATIITSNLKDFSRIEGVSVEKFPKR